MCCLTSRLRLGTGSRPSSALSELGRAAAQTPKTFFLQGLNSSAGLLAASCGCSQLWQCLLLTDRSAEKQLNHTATSGLLDQHCLARFYKSHLGMSCVLRWCSCRAPVRALQKEADMPLPYFPTHVFLLSYSWLLKISRRWHTFAFFFSFLAHSFPPVPLALCRIYSVPIEQHHKGV